MEFSISSGQLIDILSVMSTVAKLGSDSIDQYVLMDVNEDSAYFLASSGHRSIDHTTLDAKIVRKGRCAVPYAKFNRFVSSFRTILSPECLCTMVLAGDVLEVIILNEDGSTKAVTSIPVTNAQRIPLPKPFEETDFILNSNILKGALTKIRRSVDIKHSVEYLRNVYLVFEDGVVFLAGTDGITLSEVIIPGPQKEVEGKFMVPIEYIVGIITLSKEDMPLLVSMKDGSIKIKSGATVYSGLLTATQGFPANYKEHFSNRTYEVSLELKQLVATLSAFQGTLDNDSLTKINLTFSDLCVKLSSQNSEFTIDHEVSGLPDVAIGVDGIILLNLIKAFVPEEEVTFKFNADKTPLLLHLKSEEPALEHTVMIAQMQ